MEVVVLNKAIIGKNIHQLIAGSRLSQKQLANIMNVSASTVSNWEKGMRMPTLVNVLNLCNYFGVSVDDLIGVSNMKK